MVAKKNPSCLIFDVDGVLAESRQPASKEMIGLLLKLIDKKYWIALVTGGSIDLVRKQVINQIPLEYRKSFIVFPQSAGEMWVYLHDQENGDLAYEFKLKEKDQQKIKGAIQIAMKKYSIKKVIQADPSWPQIENRGAQICFSMLGSNAPLEIKKAYDPDQAIRKPIAKFLQKWLPEYTVTIGGTTSIDISLATVHKGISVPLLQKFGFPKKRMVAFADAFYPGGNDEPIKKTNIHCIPVKNPEETLEKLKRFV